MAQNGLTFIKRQRTLCLDIKSAANGKCSIEEWMDFIISDMKVDVMEITSANVHGMTGKLMVTFMKEEIFKEKLLMVSKGLAWTKKNGRLVYGWSTEEYLTTVKISNWSPFFPEAMIVEKMAGFGEVVSCHRGTLPGFPSILNNTLMMRMKLKPGVELPPVLQHTAWGEILQISWEGSERVCFKCLGQGHTVAFCRQSSSFQNVEEAEINSWAAIAAGKTSSGSAGRRQEKQKKKGKGQNHAGGQPGRVGSQPNPSVRGSEAEKVAEKETEAKKSPPVVIPAVDETPEYVSLNDASSQESDGPFLPLGQGGDYSADMELDENKKRERSVSLSSLNSLSTASSKISKNN